MASKFYHHHGLCWLNPSVTYPASLDVHHSATITTFFWTQNVSWCHIISFKRLKSPFCVGFYTFFPPASNRCKTVAGWSVFELPKLLLQCQQVFGLRLSARQPWARKNDGYILHKWLYDGYRMDINKICIYIHILKNHWYILWLYHGHYIMDINIYIYIYLWIYNGCE